MADIGQDAASLKIKVMETEVTIDEKRFAQRRIQLEKLRLTARDHELDQSIKAIDDQIALHQEDLKSLQTAFKAASTKN